MSPPARQNAMSPPARQNATSPPGRQNVMSPPLPGAAPQPATTGQPIPRANFTPSVPTARPRSRSFSGFTNSSQEERMQALAQGSREEGASPLASVKPLQITTKRSKSAMATTTTVAANVPAPQRATVSHSSSVVRGVHAPSPLSLSQNNVVAVPPPVRSPPPRASTNPLPSTSPSLHAADAVASGSGAQMARALSLDHAAATVALSANGIGRGSPAPQTQSPLSALQETIAMSSSPPPSPRSPNIFPKASPVLRHSRSAVLSTGSKLSEGVSSPRSGTASLPRPSVDTQRSDSTPPPITSPADNASETSSVLGLKITKRNRPQMPPLRLVTSKDSNSHDPRSPTLSVNTMNTSVSEYGPDQETVQVQDMDFELVRPNISASPFAGSVESLPMPSPMRADGFLRADSPAMSSASGSSSFRQPGDQSPNETKSPKENSEIEAHRQREQRWIAAMSSVPPSQARKSKKIRKLVLEGVPASVRYQVWATLTDSKGKRMEGLYQKLAQREKVPVYAEIERDIQQCFTEHPQLKDGSLAKLLQAYLSMVPDVQYNKGLALIAGQLLLQSPEEDAFWTFISLMDSHLRPYFSNSVQLEVDASLFAKALEANDSPCAKKVFGDMAIAPATICRPWFMAVFADTLPPDYLLRVWDVFLFEGVTFLFRAGLAIFVSSRRSVLQATSPDSVFDALFHPPLASLPASPDAFIELAFSVKFKDDDVRKQRNKLEAQVKRRTQPRASPLTTTPTISLPKS
ncbi:RabGAP/TBC [Cubamyces menziesii]|nr:RabGAP/TBC [Cubamyces menziesii]